MMAGSKRSKRVSWPNDGSLCKVRLFLSEDAPCHSGVGAQDHLQAKAAWLLHAEGLVDSDALPPGFEAPHKHQPEIHVSQIPIIKWQCPSKLSLNPEWRVVAGEESEEVDVENRRQPGVLEAVYPRLSSIPPDPSITLEVLAATVDDSRTPLIPITGIEEEDGADQPETVSPSFMPLPNAGTLQSSSSTFEQLRSQPIRSGQTPAPVAEPDVLAAASAAFTAIMKSSEEGSLIDRDLLIKILSDPVMVEKLASEYGVQKENLLMQPSHQPAAAAPAAPPRQHVFSAPAASLPRPPPHIAPSAPSPASAPLPAPPPMTHAFHMPGSIPPPPMNARHLPPMTYHPHPMPIAPPPQQAPPPPPVKDANYYKNLIQMHGGDKTEPGGDLIGHGITNQRDAGDSKPRFSKPCMYFNTSRGCRHGASCLYLHDASLVPQQIEQSKGATKRIKLDRGIAGRN